MTTTLVLGGTHSGRMRYARQQFNSELPVTAINAGGWDVSEEQIAQIHGTVDPLARPKDETVIHTGDVTRAMLRARTPVLVDCLGTWVMGLLNQWNDWTDIDSCLKRAEQAAYELGALWSMAPYDAVAIAPEVGVLPVPKDARARVYQDVLSRVNGIVGEASDRTHLLIGGRVMDLTGRPAAV